MNNDDKERVFAELLGDFKRDALPYLAKEDFPRRFSQSKYRELLQNPHKYRSRLESL